MLTIILGDYGSGKTTTAKWLAKQYGGVHLRSEMLVRGNMPMVDKLKKIMQPDTSYYLDGWNGQYNFGDLPKLLGVEIRYIACMASPERIHKAQQKRVAVASNLPRTTDEIRITTQYAAAIAMTYDEAPLFADTTTRPITFWNKNDWLNRWMEINLYGQLKDKNEYQDVELNGYYITGLSQSYKTWERLAAMVDFKGKSVCDYGCNLGYFSFKAEQARAASVTGVDIAPTVMATVRSIAMVKHSKAHFVIADLKKYWPRETDIIMALNTLHHLDYDRNVLLRMFGLANTVVLEMPEKDLSSVIEIANRCGLGIEVASSHREGRCIAIYSRFEPIKIPAKYVYHPRRERVRWWLIRTAAKCYPLRAMFHLWRKLR